MTPPRVGTTLTVGAALALSTIPSLLPRSSLTQGLLTGTLVLLALAVLAVRLPRIPRLPRICRNYAPESRKPMALAEGQGTAPPPARARWIVLAATSAVLTVVAGATQLSLATRAAELGMPGPSPAYWPLAAVGALLVVGLGLALATGARRLTRIAWRRTPRPLAAVLLAGVAVTTAAAGPIDVLGPLRKQLDPAHVMLTPSPLGATRTFVTVDETPTPEAGAELAVHRLVADGGLDRSAIVVVLPTGSGWVNAEAVAAFERQLGGDVALVSAQYGDLPSWWSFLIDQEPAMRSAEALVAGTLERVGDLPEAERPDVFLVGESLGALAGQAALAEVDPEAVCGVLWSGAPGGAVSGHPRERTLRNPDDPVFHLSVATALQRPEDWPGLWVPGLSYGTTVLDLGASLAPERGHGHRYGVEQDWSLPEC